MPRRTLNHLLYNGLTIRGRIHNHQEHLKAKLAAMEHTLPPDRWAALKPVIEIASDALDNPGLPRTYSSKTPGDCVGFHFNITRILKTSPATAIFNNGHSGDAIDHQAYIERMGVIERPPSAPARNLRNGGEFCAEETSERGPCEPLPVGFGNIADNFADRLEFWRLVEETERSPKHHTLRVDKNEDPATWDLIRSDAEAPALLVDLANDTVSEKRLVRGHHQYGQKGLPARRDIGSNILVDENEAIAIAQYLNACNASPMAFEIEARGGGSIQTRLFAELPHLLPVEDHLAIAEAFCALFERRSEIDPQSGEQMPPIRFHAVIRAPTEHDDSLNPCLHVVFYERPARQMPGARGRTQWDFAIAGTKTDQRRHTRTTYPHAQRVDRSFAMRDWPKRARERFAKLVNDKLAERGFDLHYDQRTFGDGGNDPPPATRVHRDACKQDIARGKSETSASCAEPWTQLELELELELECDIDPATDALFVSQISRLERVNSPFADIVASHRRSWKIAGWLAKFHQGEADIATVVLEELRAHLEPALKTGSLDPGAAEALRIVAKSGEFHTKLAASQRGIAAWIRDWIENPENYHES